MDDSSEAYRGFDPVVGVPDSFQRLCTPHRMAYVAGDAKPASPEEGDSPQARKRCPFCVAPRHEDSASLVVARGETSFVVMNLYPYNPGHLLICPYRHVPDYTDLTETEVREIGALTQTAMRVIRLVAAPAGFNIGMNQGVAGGAGIASHLHQHVVPRWTGDANFLPVIGQTKALPELLGDTHTRLQAAWQNETNPEAEDAK